MTKKKSIYDPVREHIWNIVKCIDLISSKKNSDECKEIILLLEFINITMRQCEIYLNFKLNNLRRKNGN